MTVVVSSTEFVIAAFICSDVTELSQLQPHAHWALPQSACVRGSLAQAHPTQALCDTSIENSYLAMQSYMYMHVIHRIYIPFT
jgi:hypothetical protein